MEQNNNYYQQNWNLQPTPPKKNNRWVIWVILGVVFVGLLSGLFYFVSQVGKNFGGALNKLASNEMYRNDSMRAYNKFDNLLSVVESDSNTTEIKDKLTQLKTASDSLYQTLNILERGFLDTLGNPNGISGMDKRVAFNYFIKSGRAKKLKQQMLQFQNDAIQNLPIERRDSSLYSIMMIDLMSSKMPAFMKKMTDFENLNFNQPPFTVKISISKLKTVLGTFDNSILAIWSEEIDKRETDTQDSIK